MSKRYVCPECEESSTADEWTEASWDMAECNKERNGSTYPEGWIFLNADPGDTVTCPKCEWESERNEVEVEP
jgi:Zn ribbon nucleic-acid-binding protein